MSALSATDALTLAEATRIVREAIKDKTYLTYPLGNDAAEYLRHKRKRLTDASYRTYEGSLDKLCRRFTDLKLEDLEPPMGTQRIEEFLDHEWGTSAPRTYNTNLSILSDFFKFHVKRQHLHGDPTLAIDRARARQVHRTTFTGEQHRAIIAQQPDRRDRIALHLLLDYGIRKSALRSVQFKHFDFARERLTVFTKGGKVHTVPIPDPAFWIDLSVLKADEQWQPNHYLICGRRGNQRTIKLDHDRPASLHFLHDWWYRCLERADVVAEGERSGERMHKARHTAGQRVLDATGNLPAVKALLGHKSIQTTADIYLDWDLDRLAVTMTDVLNREAER